MKKTMTNAELCTEVRKISARNRKVEQEKRWETSWTRRLFITMMTYVVVLTYLYIVDNPSPWINALVPAAGYLLSTLALGWLRELWRKNIE
jgi:hypothetical protein